MKILFIGRISMSATINRPILDEFELEELSYQLSEAMGEQREVILSVWGGESVRGRITKMDGYTKLIHIEGYDGVKKVPFLNILKVDYPD